MPQPAKDSSYDQGLKLASAGKHLQAIEYFEQALAVSPSDTRVLFALGNTARALDQPALARQFYSQVLALEPGRVEALVNLANLLRKEGQFQAARALLEPALARNPQSPELQLTLGSVWQEEGDHEKAARHYRAALAQNSNYAPALSNLADLAADAGDYADALALYDQALKSDPGNSQMRLNRAILHLMTGHLREGWRDYEARVKIPGKVAPADLSLKAWTGGPLNRARLLVRCEQGVGDEIMFASQFCDLIARAARDQGSMILECDKRLVPLFARSFPGADVHATERNRAGIAEYGWLKSHGGATAVILAGTLPRYLRKSLDDFASEHAYLKPDLGEQIRWQGVFAALGPSPVIGICWRSGKGGGLRARNFAPLAAWADFLKQVPGALVCAQYDARAEEIAELEARSGRKIFVPPRLDQKNELDRTAAMLSALDVLVSAPTAVAWLGAAAGVKTLKLLYDKSWTSLGQAHEPLAPCCLCVMPQRRGDWADGFRQALSLIAQS